MMIREAVGAITAIEAMAYQIWAARRASRWPDLSLEQRALAMTIAVFPKDGDYPTLADLARHLDADIEALRALFTRGFPYELSGRKRDPSPELRVRPSQDFEYGRAG